MNIVNATLKKIGFFMIHLTALIEAYALSMFFSGSIIAFSLMVISLFTKTLPVFAVLNYTKLYFLLCIPFAVVYFVMIEVKLHSAVTKAKAERKLANALGKFNEKRKAEKEAVIKEAEESTENAK